MLWRLILKLMFKVSLPLVALVGVMSYGHYLQGGDPAAIWRTIGGGAMAKASNMFGNARDGVTGLGQKVANAGDLSDGTILPSTTTQIYTWTDANGQTHYSQSAPPNQQSTVMNVDSTTNVLVGFSESNRPVPDFEDNQGSGDIARGDPWRDEQGNTPTGDQRMPGMAGMVSGGQKPGDNPAEGVDVQALMKLLQAR